MYGFTPFDAVWIVPRVIALLDLPKIGISHLQRLPALSLARQSSQATRSSLRELASKYAAQLGVRRGQSGPAVLHSFPSSGPDYGG
jgi:hypothetical protein